MNWSIPTLESRTITGQIGGRSRRVEIWAELTDDPKTAHVTVNWSALGSVPIQEAAAYKALLDIALVGARVWEEELAEDGYTITTKSPR